jgi:hypothetical protein
MSTVSTNTILRTANDMLGDGQGKEWGDNPEYTRAVIEFVSELIPVPAEILDKGGDDRNPFILGMIFAANL